MLSRSRKYALSVFWWTGFVETKVFGRREWMYTPLLAITLTLAAPTESLSWSTDYSAARQQSEKAGKPLAVFIGSGAKGYEKLSNSGELSGEIKQLLASNYVCVYIDSATENGKNLATAFE